MYSQNLAKGVTLESLVNNIFSIFLDASVIPHYTNREGLDLQAYIDGKYVIAEMVNWYGGYIHPKRFSEICKSLSTPADIKLFICCGVKPTKEQRKILKSMNVKVIHRKHQLIQCTAEEVEVLHKRILGVITHYN